MKYLLPLLLACLSFSSALGLTNFKNDSLVAENQGLKGDIYLNISFVKAGENHDTYTLEQAIDQAKVYLEENFTEFGIHFFYLPSTEYLGSQDQLLEEWKNYTLPRFKNELTIYVYGEEDIPGEAHKYSFLGLSPEIALVPYYNQKEFNKYILKNILHLLGLDLNTLNEAMAQVSDPVQHEIIQRLSIKNRLFFEETFIPKKSGLFTSILRKDAKQENDPILDSQNVQAIRLSIAQNSYLLNKRLHFEPFENSSSAKIGVYNTLTDLN